MPICLYRDLFIIKLQAQFRFKYKERQNMNKRKARNNADSDCLSEMQPENRSARLAASQGYGSVVQTHYLA